VDLEAKKSDLDQDKKRTGANTTPSFSVKRHEAYKSIEQTSKQYKVLSRSDV